MEKETVLEIEFQPVFDKWAWRITKQNEEILKKGTFEDKNIGVYSVNFPCYNYYNCTLGIRGNNENKDNLINLCTEDEKREIEIKVRNINEKYGIPKRWRAGKGEVYYLMYLDFRVIKEEEDYAKTDTARYNFGNYFKTKNEALEYAEYMKQKSLEWHEIRGRK
nr:MAG TPA: hypothetical protein [Caudoviricetes sp.]